MKLSIIIPAYNAVDTLAETLASLQVQSCAEWEAIVVDDGSDDATAVVAQQAAEQDGRIRLVRQPNSGVSVARNHGARLAAPSDYCS